jgi:hypothetical protein
VGLGALVLTGTNSQKSTLKSKRDTLNSKVGLGALVMTGKNSQQVGSTFSKSQGTLNTWHH